MSRWNQSPHRFGGDHSTQRIYGACMDSAIAIIVSWLRVSRGALAGGPPRGRCAYGLLHNNQDLLYNNVWGQMLANQSHSNTLADDQLGFIENKSANIQESRRYQRR